MSLRAFGATLAPRAGAVSSLLAKATDCFGKFTLAMTYGKINKVTENNPVALWFKQDMYRIRLRPYRIALLLALTFTSACAPRAADTPFRPPTQAAPTQILSTTTPIPAIYTTVPTSTVTATPTEGPCSNNLEFLQDVTIPDGTTVSAGAAIDKHWLVDNNGTCNWDSSYRLKWIGGDPLGANQEQILYPARAGTQATLRIIFTAPTVAGTYESAWQAYGSDGIAFGDPIFIKIVVTL